MKGLPPGSKVGPRAKLPAGMRMPKPARRSKYRNQPVTVAGHRFASKKEMARYMVLRAMEEAGHIHALRLQPRYLLWVGDVHVCDYIADFEYVQFGVLVVEDVKSPVTRKHPVYRLKVKLLRACLGLVVTEV